MGLNTAKIDDFSGGINLVDDEAELKGGELGRMSRNVEPSGTGELLFSRRPTRACITSGFALPVSSGFNTFTSVSTYRHPSFTVDSIIASNDNGKVITTNVDLFNSVVVERIVGSGGPNKEWVFEQSQDNAGTLKVYMLNGTDTPQAFSIVAGTVAAWPGTPPNGKVLKSWKNLMCIAGVAAQPQRLYYSQPNNPELWTSPGGFIDIKSVDDELDEIIALEVVGENLLVFKRNSVWLVFDPVTFENRRIANIGVVNRHCAAIQDDRVFFNSVSGIYSTDGDTLRLESRNIATLFTHKTGSDTKLDRLIGTYENKVLWRTGGACYVLDLLRKREDGQYAWYVHNQSMGIITGCTRARIDPDAIGDVVPAIVGFHWNNPIGGAQQLAIYLYPKGSSAVDVISGAGTVQSVGAIYDSPWMPIQGTENLERIRRLNIHARGRYTVEVYKDFAPFVLAFSQVVPDTGSSGQFSRVRPETRARFHKIRITYNETDTAQAKLELRAIEIKYRGGKEH